MLRGGNQRVRANAGGQQGLVRIAEGRLRDPQCSLVAQLLRPLDRTEFQQVIAGTTRQFTVVKGRELLRGLQDRRPLTIRLVHGHICQIGQDLAGIISGRWCLQQARMLSNKAGVNALVAEVRFAEECAEETNIRRYAIDRKLVEGAQGTINGDLEIAPAARHFDQ